MSNEQKSWMFSVYRGWNPTQLYRADNKPWNKDPYWKRQYFMESKGPVFFGAVAHMKIPKSPQFQPYRGAMTWKKTHRPMLSPRCLATNIISEIPGPDDHGIPKKRTVRFNKSSTKKKPGQFTIFPKPELRVFWRKIPIDPQSWGGPTGGNRSL